MKGASALDLTIAAREGEVALSPDASSGWMVFARSDAGGAHDKRVNSPRASRVRLPRGAHACVELAIVVEEHVEGALRVRRELERRPALEWFLETVRYHQARYGMLAIAEAPAIAESVPRFAENCRQSLLCSSPDAIDGGFLGSDVDARDITWNRDPFYNALAMGLFEPRLCAAAIPFFLRWGSPPHPTPRGLARFPGAGPITQSIGNAVAGLALAAAYYRFTGDREFFLRWPAFLEQARARLDTLAATRRKDAFLFPSMFVSNGDARGQAHTGSNVLAWYAFDGMARLAREVYADHTLAERWSGVARQVRADVLRRCTGAGPRGPQFFEGVFDDHTWVPGHDGEESDTTLMPFYGFCDADEPRLLHHAAVALTPMNPYYAEALDAIWWHNHGGFRPATMPGWMTALASAATERDVEARLTRIRQVTDLDGSLWWWPYRYGETDRAAVLRGNGAAKCGWASAIYLLRFIHVVLGLEVDVPARTLRVRPFHPWTRMTWRESRLGAACFDITLDRRAPSAPSAIVVNRNAYPFDVTVELRLPSTGRLEQRGTISCEVDGMAAEADTARYFDATTFRVTRTVPAGGALHVRRTAP